MSKNSIERSFNNLDTYQEKISLDNKKITKIFWVLHTSLQIEEKFEENKIQDIDEIHHVTLKDAIIDCQKWYYQLDKATSKVTLYLDSAILHYENKQIPLLSKKLELQEKWIFVSENDNIKLEKFSISLKHRNIVLNKTIKEKPKKMNTIILSVAFTVIAIIWPQYVYKKSLTKENDTIGDFIERKGIWKENDWRKTGINNTILLLK
jgi:hypothetical protein